MSKIIAKFQSVEQAERAATRVRSIVQSVGAITVTSRTRNKDVDTPFMLPYAPQNGLDPWIMLPANYGYNTPSGYLEKINEVDCSVETPPEKCEAVTAVLHNCGALSVERK